MSHREASFKKLTRRVGDVTLYLRGGMLVARVRHNSSRPRQATKKQMDWRLRWCNQNNLWKAFPPLRRPAFEGRKPGTSDFNRFLSHAMQTEPVYLTRSQVDNGACVLTSVVVSEGTLPEINVTHDGIAPATDIALGNLVIDDVTTVGTLSAAIVRHNRQFGYGDGLLFYAARQLADPLLGMPVVKVECAEVVLDGGDGRLLLHDGVARLGFASRAGVLAAAAPMQGGVAWVHTRGDGSAVRRSTQRMVVDNAALARYSGGDAFEAASRSFGGYKDAPFLAPDREEQW